MNIDEYLKSKEITPDELENNFKMVRKLSLDTLIHKSCFNCGYLLNNKNLPTGA